MVLNTCPTSNVVLGVFPGFDEHPLAQLRDAGVRLTLGSDDPPYFGATIGGEYRVCAERLGFTRGRPADGHPHRDRRRLLRRGAEVRAPRPGVSGGAGVRILVTGSAGHLGEGSEPEVLAISATT